MYNDQSHKCYSKTAVSVILLVKKDEQSQIGVKSRNSSFLHCRRWKMTELLSSSIIAICISKYFLENAILYSSLCCIVSILIAYNYKCNLIPESDFSEVHCIKDFRCFKNKNLRKARCGKLYKMQCRERSGFIMH